ncbi:hypothetical protein L1987_01075 [Smallanthus sonchifolius]|uniref:Uncharacterized protein n=1 Tax=Smallanthus sonchifolius TaxID=185202 RepID=A0ACB9K489_9ASTR|nr:hypothetical protein L1987_01075 [Smallanthus sonchifolius]
MNRSSIRICLKAWTMNIRMKIAGQWKADNRKTKTSETLAPTWNRRLGRIWEARSTQVGSKDDLVSQSRVKESQEASNSGISDTIDIRERETENNVLVGEHLGFKMDGFQSQVRNRVIGEGPEGLGRAQRKTEIMQCRPVRDLCENKGVDDSDHSR